MHLDLTAEDARFLQEQLIRHLEEIENELVHTDKRDLQREIAQQAKRLRELIARIENSTVH